MAWVATKTWTTGDIVTAAEGNAYWRDDLDYLKGKADAFDTHDAGTAKAQHDGGAGTHTHQSAGAEGGQLDHGAALTGLLDDDHTQYVKKAGDTGLGQTFTRAIDNGGLVIAGGLSLGASVTLYGKDAVAGSTGRIRAQVPNAAKDGLAIAFEFSGVTDTPEMVLGTIPTARLKEYVISTYTGNGSGAQRQIATGFACKCVLIQGDYGDISSDDTTWLAMRVGVSSMVFQSGQYPTTETEVTLHASDGFLVGDATNIANKNGETYNYVAMG